MIIFLILTCDKNIDREQFVRSTWLKNIKYLFLKADPNIPNNHKVVKDTLYVKCEEIYENLPRKMVLAYSYLANMDELTGVFKIDDDCVPDLNRLIPLIEKYKNVPYFGRMQLDPKHLDLKHHFGKCKSPILNCTPYSKKIDFGCCLGGHGYYLSKKSLKVIQKVYFTKKDELFKGEYYEDVLVGRIMHENMIEYMNFTNISFRVNMGLKKHIGVIYFGEFEIEKYSKLWKKICDSQ